MAEAVRQPFFYGGPIPTALADVYLYGFEEERRKLAGYLNARGPGAFAVLGPRASGKTSLTMAVASRFLVPRVHIDCGRTWPSTRRAFLQNLLTAIGLPVPAGYDFDAPAADAYAGLPAPKRGTRGIVVLENAHELAELEAALVDEIPVLAARLPFQLIVTGEPTTIAPVVPGGIELAPFSAPTAAGFLERQFGLVGASVDDAAHPIFYEFSRGNPEVLQRLGALTWDRMARESARRATAAHVEAAVADAVERLPTFAVAALSALRGIMRDIFVGMCLYDVESPTEIAQRLGLEPKNVVVLLGRLEDPHRLVDRVERGRYHVRDPLVKHYVRKEWGSPIVR